MFGAVASVVLGVLSLVGTVPVVLPVFGLALGLNGLIKEKKRSDKRKNIVVICWIGVVINALPTLLFAIGRLKGI